MAIEKSKRPKSRSHGSRIDQDPRSFCLTQPLAITRSALKLKCRALSRDRNTKSLNSDDQCSEELSNFNPSLFNFGAAKIKPSRNADLSSSSIRDSGPKNRFLPNHGIRSGRSTPNLQAAGSSRSPTQQRRQPRIQVASLLSEPHSRSYQLEVVQHPVRTAAFENNILSRLPLSPPIVVRLVVRDPMGNSVFPDQELPFLIAHLSLLDEHGEQQLDTRGESRILYGDLVSMIEHPLEDLQGNMGLFFIYPDVSVRWRGRFQLGVTLVRLSSMDANGAMTLGTQGIVLAETRSRTFDVVPQSQYTAVPQTRLTHSFVRQGARMFPVGS